MIKASIVFVALVGSLIGSARATGENASLKDTPAAKFNADDYALMKARVDQALKAGRDGEKLEWKNDKTGASGEVTPLNRLVWNELPCRRLRIVNTYGNTTGQGVYKFCEKPAGHWKLVGPDGPQH